MRNFLTLLLSLSLCSTAFADDPPLTRRNKSRTGEAAGYSSRNATVLSMMGWGLGLAAGFATLCALIDNSDSSSDGGHSHNSH